MITMNDEKGMWIAIDGCECSGKTTLVTRVKNSYPDIVLVPEFSKTSLGIWLENEVVSKPYFVTNSSMASALLFLSDYFEMQKQIVIPALEDGKIVISDRGFLSKVAVQYAMLEGEFGKEAEDFLKKIFAFSLRPHLSIVLDNQESVIYERIVKRSGSCDQERLEMNKRTNELLRYFAQEFELPHKCLPFDDAEFELRELIEFFKRG